MLWALALLGLVVVVGSSSTGKAASKPSSGRCGSKWAGNLARLRPSMDKLEAESGWVGLADFLTIVAFQESCGALDSIHDGGIGRGPFALHSTTSSVQALGGASALPLMSIPEVAVAAAATHAYRLTRGSYEYPRDDTRWQDVDAGWAIPSWTGNRNAPAFTDSKGNVKTRDAVVGRFVQRAQQLGRANFPQTRALPDDWQWPGLTWALETLGHSQHAVDPDSPAA